MIQSRSKRRLIYLDNAATSLPKAPGVARAVASALERAGNPGRSGHSLSIKSARDLHAARERIAELFDARDSSRFVFTLNATMALNTAILGVVRPGDRVVTTSCEHNSVMRPLRALEETADVDLVVVPCDVDGSVPAKRMAAAIRAKKTRLVVMAHAGNVIGAIQPIEDVAVAARKAGALTLIDAAQTAGVLPISLSQVPIDMLAAPGHKGLLGPQGTGFLFVRDGVTVSPLMRGGTGSHSESDRQPDFLPDALESGTPNSVGIAGLSTSLRWLISKGIGAVRRAEEALLAELLDGLGRIPRVTVFGPSDPMRRVAVVPFLVEGFDAGEVSAFLERRHGILSRPGLHCAPGAHRTIGTFPGGTVRLSPGPFTTRAEIRTVVRAVRELAGRSHLA